jgi:hypothetical protein
LKKCKGRFTGDPSHEFECITYKVEGEGEDEKIETESVISFCLKITQKSIFIIKFSFSSSHRLNSKKRTDFQLSLKKLKKKLLLFQEAHIFCNLPEKLLKIDFSKVTSQNIHQTNFRMHLIGIDFVFLISKGCQ